MLRDCEHKTGRAAHGLTAGNHDPLRTGRARARPCWPPSCGALTRSLTDASDDHALWPPHGRHRHPLQVIRTMLPPMRPPRPMVSSRSSQPLRVLLDAPSTRLQNRGFPSARTSWNVATMPFLQIGTALPLKARNSRRCGCPSKYIFGSANSKLDCPGSPALPRYSLTRSQETLVTSRPSNSTRKLNMESRSMLSNAHPLTNPGVTSSMLQPIFGCERQVWCVGDQHEQPTRVRLERRAARPAA